jgi:hypothetical protein
MTGKAGVPPMRLLATNRARKSCAGSGEESREAADRQMPGAQPYRDIEEIALWAGHGRSRARRILAEHAEERREAQCEGLFIPDWYR